MEQGGTERIEARKAASIAVRDSKALHAILNEKAPLYGLSRIELVPVRKPEAVAFYLGGYLSESLAHKPEDAKGTRAVNYSHKCPRVFRGQWSWANPCGWVWRAKLESGTRLKRNYALGSRALHDQRTDTLKDHYQRPLRL